MAKDKGGRPTVVTEGVLLKLRQAFLLGCSDEEACLMAGISVATLYKYQNKNEKFIDEKKLLKKNPTLIARTTVVNDLSNDSGLALKYLERKEKGEFSVREERTGAEGKDLTVTINKQVIDAGNND